MPNETTNPSHDKRFDFWNYLTSEKIQRPRGVTHLRLMTMKKEVIEDDAFWFQIIVRFGAENSTAKEFYQSKTFASEQSKGNFWSLIRERILRRK